jgi:hypothetical protein
MKTKKCSACQSDIDIKATICPHCRTKQVNKTVTVITTIIIILIFFGIINAFTGKETINNSTITKQEIFNASVRFTGTQFIISNLDPKDCENTQIRLNSDYQLDGYTLKSFINSIDKKTNKGITYTVGAGQFTKKDGTRFNSFNMKPLNFYIGCQGNNELQGAYWYGKF